MAVTLFFSFVVATFVCMVLIPPLVRAAEAFRLLDLPGERKVHEAPMSRLGGVAMITAALVPPLIWATPLPSQLVSVLVGIVIILCFGLWDDVRGLDYRLKFLGQLFAVLLVVLHGDVTIRYLPFSGLVPLPAYLSIPLTVFVLVGVTNAINLADGLDGLAGGITLLSLLMIAVLAYPTGDTAFLIVTISVIGCIVGFLRYNTYPARIFMGDAGSQFLGFSAGVLVIILTQSINTALSPALPILILGLPLLDTATVMWERCREGRSPFLPDKRHLHHKLLAVGFHHYEAVFLVYSAQTVAVAAAYFLRFEADWLVIMAYALFCATVIGLLRRALSTHWRFHGRPAHAVGSHVPRWLRWMRQDQRMLKTAFYFAVAGISIFTVLGAVLVERVPADIGALALVLLAVSLCMYVSRRQKRFNIVERACTYVAGICVVYLVWVAPGALERFTVYRNILLGLMMIAVAIGFRFSHERFKITTMDYIVILLALAVPHIAGATGDTSNTAIAVAMLIVLYYSIELVLSTIERRWDYMRYTTYLTLAVIAFRGVLRPFIE